MPDQTEYPGVYVDEEPPGKSIDGVPTAGCTQSAWRRALTPAVFFSVGAAVGAGVVARRSRKNGVGTAVGNALSSTLNTVRREVQKLLESSPGF